MMFKNAIDWLFCTDWGLTQVSRPERKILYIQVSSMCPLDHLLDSPCPRWLLNIALCTGLSYRQRIKLILKHHEMLTGQNFGVLTSNDTLLVKKEKKVK